MSRDRCEASHTVELVGRCVRAPRGKRKAARARAFAAASSRLRDGADVTSASTSRRAAAATSSTARPNAASFAFDGFVAPLIFSGVGLRPTPRLSRSRGPVAPLRSLAGRAVRGLAVLANL